MLNETLTDLVKKQVSEALEPRDGNTIITPGYYTVKDEDLVKKLAEDEETKYDAKRAAEGKLREYARDINSALRGYLDNEKAHSPKGFYFDGFRKKGPSHLNLEVAFILGSIARDVEKFCMFSLQEALYERFPDDEKKILPLKVIQKLLGKEKLPNFTFYEHYHKGYSGNINQVIKLYGLEPKDIERLGEELSEKCRYIASCLEK